MALTRRPPAIPAEPLTPSLIFLLVTGRECAEWLPGWVGLAQDPRSPDTIRRAVWPSAADHIRADVAPFGFAPWGETGRPPRGPAVADWARAFVATHGRHT